MGSTTEDVRQLFKRGWIQAYPPPHLPDCTPYVRQLLELYGDRYRPLWQVTLWQVGQQIVPVYCHAFGSYHPFGKKGEGDGKTPPPRPVRGQAEFRLSCYPHLYGIDWRHEFDRIYLDDFRPGITDAEFSTADNAEVRDAREHQAQTKEREARTNREVKDAFDAHAKQDRLQLNRAFERGNSVFLNDARGATREGEVQ
jgi:hypothetical protein